MKVNWRQKLTSRKFWTAVSAFVGAVLCLFNVAEADIVKISAVIAAAGVLMIYIYTEGKIDAARVNEHDED